jgi:hypothetical protein
MLAQMDLQLDTGSAPHMPAALLPAQLMAAPTAIVLSPNSSSNGGRSNSSNSL